MYLCITHLVLGREDLLNLEHATFVQSEYICFVGCASVRALRRPAVLVLPVTNYNAINRHVFLTGQDDGGVPSALPYRWSVLHERRNVLRTYARLEGATPAHAWASLLLGRGPLREDLFDSPHPLLAFLRMSELYITQG